MKERTKENIHIAIGLIAMICNPGCWIGWAMYYFIIKPLDRCPKCNTFYDLRGVKK